MDELKKFVINEISEVTGLEENEKCLTVQLKEHEADSLDIFQIASDVEEKFGVSIKEKVNTGQDIILIAADQLNK
ncbi:hypothetical protein BTW26_05455 [Pediococcus acidilactici]|jgi:acyl carrier protein|uniref:acyl carrier protein n=1 Tax=Pediococcus acidilactici TaxID=1254 RepID=UPI0009473131|nr:acyl carrier protein [Pediococcus acidilactici]APR28488.1 hypothetical protein BTW26_05455 [Pediococcus acidilactici]